MSAPQFVSWNTLHDYQRSCFDIRLCPITWIVAAIAIASASGSPCCGQQLKPRASSDPYFQAKRAAKTETVLPSSDSAGSVDKTEKAKTGNEVNSLPAIAGEHVAGSIDSPSDVVGSTIASGEAFQPGQVVALVGGEPIFVADMLLEMNQVLNKFMPNAPQAIKNREHGNVIRVLLPRYVEQKLLEIDTKQDLPDGVTWDKLIEQAAGDFDERALPILMEKSGVDSPTAYDANLRAMGSSLRSMKRHWCEEQIIRYFLSKKVDADPQVTRQEMLSYYEGHIEQFSHAARSRWEELMVRFDQCPTRNAAFEKIVALGNEVVYGASMEAVAKRASHGFTSHRGGQYDWTTKGSLKNKEIENAIFSLPLQELSDLIETDLGVHIIRVIEREDAHVTPFVDAQSQIKESLVAAKREASLREYVEKLRARIPVEYLIEMPAPIEAIKETANR